jgi:hypothetical protein
MAGPQTQRSRPFNQNVEMKRRTVIGQHFHRLHDDGRADELECDGS